MISLKNREKAYDLLKNYTGSNPYILMVYRDVITNGKIDEFGEFQMDYILKNINFEPIQISNILKDKEGKIASTGELQLKKTAGETTIAEVS